MVDSWFNIGVVQQDDTIYSLNPFIDRDSVKTGVAPRVSRTITTIDGREHISSIGRRQTLSFRFNPLTYAQATELVTLLCTYPAFKVSFRSLTASDSNDGYFDMKLSGVSADYLSRCKFGGAEMFQFDDIELEQL